MGRRWTSVAADGGELYVWSENGIIASFDGEAWQELTTIAPHRGSLVVGGSRLFVWQRDLEELHVWHEGVSEHLVEAEGPAIVGDASHVYIPTHTTSDRTWEFARWTEAGLVPIVEPPDGVLSAVAGGSQLAIVTYGDEGFVLSLLRDDEWISVASGETPKHAFAIDSDGTMLVQSRSALFMLELFHPDGTRTPVQLGAAPQGPFVGSSLESLWTLSTSDSNRSSPSTRRAIPKSFSSHDPGRLLALGNGRLIFMVEGVSAPADDPVLFWHVFTSSEDGWSRIAGNHEYEIFGLLLSRFGTASSPQAIVLTTPSHEDYEQEAYELFDANAESVASGVWDRRFEMNLAGIDLEHMVGLSEGQLLVRNGSAEWNPVSALSPLALRAPPLRPTGAPFTDSIGFPWSGTDAVGYTNGSGTTICTYDW